MLEGPVVEEGPLIPLTPELLMRWGIDPEEYKKLDEANRLKVQKWISMGERWRVAAVARIRRLAGDRWREFVNPQLFPNAKGLKLLGREFELSRIILTNTPDEVIGKPLLESLFDGSPRSSNPDPGLFLNDLQIRNEQIRRLRVTYVPWDLDLEMGQLGLGARNGLMAPSPYINLKKRWESDPNSGLDYRVHASAGVIELKARILDDPPDDRPQRIVDLLGRLGLSQDKVKELKEQLTYEDPYKTRHIFVGSVVGSIGRAYPLFGPVDVGWTATQILKVSHLFPNLGLDQSLGLRMRLPKGVSVGVFGGLSENLSFISNTIMREAFTEKGPRAGFYGEVAPHVAVALWGPMPYMSDARFELIASNRWNHDTQVRKIEAGLLTSLGRIPTRVGVSYSQETGPSIEFERKRLRAEIAMRVTKNGTGYLAWEKENFQFGNAEVNHNSVLAGFSLDLDQRTRITLDHVLGHTDNMPLQRGIPSAAKQMNDMLVDGLKTAEDASKLWAQWRDREPTDDEILRLAQHLGRLGPEGAGQLIDEIAARGGFSGSSAELWTRLNTVAFGADDKVLDQAFGELDNVARGALSPEDYERFKTELDKYHQQAKDLRDGIEAGRMALHDIKSGLDKADKYYQEHKADLQELARLLGDESVWESVAAQAGRAALMRELQKVELPIDALGITLKADGPTILAAGHILGSRLSPIAPLTARDRDNDIRPWVMGHAGKELGIDGPVTDAAIADKLFDMAEDKLREELRGKLSNLDPRTGQWVGQALAALPPEAAAALKEKYGVDLAGLLPPNPTTEDVRKLLTERLPDEAVKWLREQYGADLKQAIGQSASWAADMIRREANRAMIRTILAAEALDEMTADKGIKAADHSVRMMVDSFNKLDARRRGEVKIERRGVMQRAEAEAKAADARLNTRMVEYGRARLEAVELMPNWPKNVKVKIADKEWAGLMTSYGDRPLFEAIEQAGKKLKPYGDRPVVVVVKFDPSQIGTTIQCTGDEVTISLPATDPTFATNRLEAIPHYAEDLAKRRK